MTSTVAKALSGAATAGIPSGTSFSILKTCDITVTGISMMTVPVTVGVRIRRSSESRAESASGTTEETTTRVASIAGPPSASAVILTAMEAPEMLIKST